MEQTLCKNCNETFDNNYCKFCGQRAIGNKRLQIGEVVSDFFDNTFNIHKGFFFTIWQLIIHPGKVANAYINGQRKTFTNPTRYLVIAIAFQTFIDYWFKTDDVLKRDEYFYFPFLSEQLNTSMEIWNIKLVMEYSLFSSLFEVMVFPAIFYFLFKSLNYNYTELLTTNFYFVATSTFITMVVLFVTKVIFGIFIPIEIIASVVALYMGWAYISFFKSTPILSRSVRIIIAILLFFAIRVLVLPLLLSIMNLQV